MSLKRSNCLAGEVVTLEHVSQVLHGNALGDPHVRKLQVWLPAQYNTRPGKRFPVLFDLVGYTGSGASHTNWRNFDENVPERVARLVHDRRMAPAIVVFPDCFTALGGNQYINSSAIGRYADYLLKELIPFVDSQFRSIADRSARGCFGKSSGGYGAVMHGMKYPEHWGAIADHSGDAYFDFVYRADWPNTLNELGKYRTPKRKAGTYDVRRATAGLKPGLDDGRVRAFLQNIWKTDKPSEKEVMCLMNLAMAASYDPDPRAPNGFRLPFDLETGALIPNRWQRWLAHDPIHMVKQYRGNLNRLRGIYIDCGWRDQFHIHYGCRLLSQQLTQHGIAHRYEEFDDTHSGVDYRMERSLPFLTRVLAKA